MKTCVNEIICTTEEIDDAIYLLIRECQELQINCCTEKIQDIATDVIEALEVLSENMDYCKDK